MICKIDIHSTDTIRIWNSIVSCSPNLQNEQLLKFVSLWIILISWIHLRGRNMHLVSEILKKRGLTRFLRRRNMHFCVSCRNLLRISAVEICVFLAFWSKFEFWKRLHSIAPKSDFLCHFWHLHRGQLHVIWIAIIYQWVGKVCFK